MAKRIDYPFEIRPLLAEEGGGFLIAYPDFSDCIFDAETVEQALPKCVAEQACPHLYRRRSWTQRTAGLAMWWAEVNRCILQDTIRHGYAE